MSFDSEKLMMLMRGLPAAQRLWVGFSGGLDSTVLLCALATQQADLSARLQALHVNHHINPQADDWQRHCQRICAALQVPLECRSVIVKPVKGQSLEAMAREQRYLVFRGLVQQDDLLLLAHHQDDQMETFLLQALRGSGLRGLASMPLLADFESGHLARPLLGFSRDELRNWADTQKLTWLEDPSNADIRFDRNYLRREVVPIIKQRWPSAAATLARSAHHCGETLELMTVLADEDWQHCAEGTGQLLSVVGVQALGAARAKNLLRHWLEKLQLPAPPAHKLEQIMNEVLPARGDRNPCVSWEDGEVRRYRGRLYGMAPLPASPNSEFRLRQGQVTALGAGLGTLELQPAPSGLRASAWPSEGLRVSFRSGGEVCKPAGQVHHRPLKKWLQDLHVVPWMRDRLPLLYIDDQLAGVAGLFVCAAYAAGSDEPGLRIEWSSHPALH